MMIKLTQLQMLMLMQKIINQMMFSKLLHLRRLLEGVGYESELGKLNDIIDPTIVASLVRNIYETAGMFNLIYINPKSTDEKRILYLLWVISGLRYRQRFASSISTAENQEKLEHEEKEIQELIDEIRSTALYKGLTEPNQKKIEEKIKKRDYKICFNSGEVEFLDWQDLSDIMGCNPKLFDNIYTYFSLYAHPSNVAVFQFRELFGKKTEDFKGLTLTNMKFCFTLFSVFAADYVKVFPQVLDTYKKRSLKEQILLNFYNKMIRGDSFSISDAWKNLE